MACEEEKIMGFFDKMGWDGVVKKIVSSTSPSCFEGRSRLII